MPHSHLPLKPTALWLSPALLLALTACGGGSDEPAATTPPASVETLRLSGTVARAAALDNADIEARCAVGQGSARSATTGNYEIVIESGRLPCVIRAAQAGSAPVTLHAVAANTGSATAAVANVSPVSELIVASLTAAEPAALFTQASATPASLGTAVTSDKLSTATTAVTTTLKDGGVDLTQAGNPLTAPLVAGASGNDLGKGLVSLDTALSTGGTSLTTLSNTVAAASTTATPASTVVAASSTLPAAAQLQAHAANCKALRSGNFRLVGQPGEPNGVRMRIDASTLVGTDLSDNSELVKLVADGPCKYTQADGTQTVFTTSGVGVMRLGGGTEPYVMVLLLPEQALAVSDFAGAWKGLGFETEEGAFVTAMLRYEFNAAGQMVEAMYASSPALTAFASLKAGDADFPPINMSARAEGGFLLSNTRDNWTQRVFAYRNGRGQLMWATLNYDHTLGMVFGQNATVLQPSVNSTSNSWNLTMNLQRQAPGAINESSNTVLSVDGIVSYLRRAIINFTTGVTREETIRINHPQPGFSERTAQSSTDSAGNPTNISRWVSAGVAGHGFSAVVFPNNSLLLSVGKQTE